MTDASRRDDPAAVHDTAHDTAQDTALTVDASGLSCPLPVIELSRAIETVPVGGRVTLLATDPAARVDVPVWCRMQRQRLVSSDEDDQRLLFLVERRH